MPESSDSICSGNPNGPCQFAKHAPRSFEYNTRHYCIAHTPIDAPSRPTHDDLSKFLKARLEQGDGDFTGVVLPENFSFHVTLPDGRLILDHCVVGSGTNINVPCDISGRNSRFIGNVVFSIGRQGQSVSFESRTEFEGGVRFDNANSSRLSFNDVTFRGQLKVSRSGNKPALAEPLTFDSCIFQDVPRFPEDVLPQQTTFTNPRFDRAAITPGNEGAFRALRNEFQKHRNRELEGIFYAYEKRCHRRSLSIDPRQPLQRWIRNCFARSLSCLYDASSAYGQSFERATLAFLVLQAVFATTYATMANRLELGAPLDTRVLAFTLLQAIRPFELWATGRQPSGLAEDVLGQCLPSGWWLLVSAIHSALSVASLTLIILAIRWRFRRE